MPTINSGSVPYGSFVVTVASAAFVGESISFNEASTTIERRTEDNDPSGLVIIPDFVSGSCVLQRATTATNAPRVGDEIQFPSVALAGFTGSFYLTEVGPNYAQADSHKFNASFRRGV